MTQTTLTSQTTLTITELHERLDQRLTQQGEEGISYQILSRLLNTGDIAEQLQIQGDRNARRVLPDVVDILAAFLPVYRRAQGRLPQAAEMLHGFLQQRGSTVPQNSTTGDQLTPVLQFHRTEEPDPHACQGAGKGARAGRHR